MKGVAVICLRSLAAWFITIFFVNTNFGSWCEGCLEEERVALLRIKNSVNYPNGSSLSNWVGDDCCQWGEVVCNFSTSRVTDIYMSGIREKRLGTWYPNATWFVQFEELANLDLSLNEIGGWTMPQGVCMLKNLESLYLSSNSLEDLPPCLGNLSKLETLDLNNNSLGGHFEISKGLHGLKDLIELHLDKNNLTDKDVSSWIGNLTSLTVLSLSGNKFMDSSLLTGICNLKNLIELDLSENAIEGAIDPCIGNMHSLQSLTLRDNDLSGVVSFSMFANFSDLQAIDLSYNPELEVETEDSTWVPTFQLMYLRLSFCKINKGSGGSIPRFLATQNQLFEVYFPHCGLTGEIPSWLFYNQTTLLKADLSSNSLGGSFPQPSQNSTSSIQRLDISNNCLQGPLPTDLGLFFPQLLHLDMYRNGLEGGIPFDVHTPSNLQVLDLSDNKFSGSIPHALATNSSELGYLSLSNNTLGGDHMLPEHCKMPSLKYLFLADNGFRKISHGLSSSTSLLVLDIGRNDLSGTIPAWLPASLSNLASLLLTGNNFVGNIPHKLCQMQNLHILDLSDNKLIGNIPSCFNNVTSWKKEVHINISEEARNSIYGSYKGKSIFRTKGNLQTYQGIPFSLMTGIDLSMNQLTGYIPVEMGDLKAVLSLNLSNNFLSGRLPKSFQNLEKIESLDLSHNNLSGPIPQEITQLNSLSIFNVSFNMLSGEVPHKTKQFQTFDNSSYVGNPDLCGGPLTRKCSSDDSPGPDHEEEEEASGILNNDAFLYLFVAISYVLGFLGFIIFILFSKRWGKIYFTAMDGYIVSCTERVSEFLRCDRRT